MKKIARLRHDYAGQSSLGATNINFLINVSDAGLPGLAAEQRRLAVPKRRIQEQRGKVYYAQITHTKNIAQFLHWLTTKLKAA